MLQVGRIVEDGPPDQLMRRAGAYRQLIDREIARLPASARPPAGRTEAGRHDSATTQADSRSQTRLAFRFWESAAGFWRGPIGAAWAWSLTAAAGRHRRCCSSLVQYGLNYWYRHFFDAFGRKDGSAAMDPDADLHSPRGRQHRACHPQRLGAHGDPAQLAGMAEPAPDRSLAVGRPLPGPGVRRRASARAPNTGSPRMRGWRPKSPSISPSGCSPRC